MDFRKFRAGPDDSGRRLDRVLRRFLPEEHLSSLYSAVRKGLVRVNGKKTTPDARISEGDELEAAAFLFGDTGNDDFPAVSGKDDTFPYEILFQSDAFIVINKPYDIPVQGPGSIAEALASYYRSLPRTGGGSLSFTPGPLHRLDRKTTGVLFLSWSLEGARAFSRGLADHELVKTYIGITENEMTGTNEWSDFLEKETGTASDAFHTVRICSSGTPGAKLALTRAEPVASGIYGGKHVTVVRFTIATGRMHQIRAQSSFHGFPLLGDTSYGGSTIHEPQSLYLHARTVAIPPSMEGLPAQITAPISTNFQKMLNKILIDRKESIIL
jgi:23S rRNA pseudouridine955/2504/2580 synthase